MIDVKFDSYDYYPALRTRQAEMRGLKELDADRKNRILPLLTVGEWPRAQDFQRSLQAARDAMDGLPFIIDITTDRARLPDLRRQLLDGSNAFQAWRELGDQYDEAIPVALTPRGQEPETSFSRRFRSNIKRAGSPSELEIFRQKPHS